MRLTVIGCSGSIPGPDSPASSYLVEAEGFRLLLDLGNGALGALARHVPIESIDAVALSHLHPDHCFDVCAYYVARRYAPGGPLPPIPVYGPEGAAERLARAYDMPPDPGMSGEFTFQRYPEGAFEIGPFTAQVTRVAHPVPAYAIRLTYGGSTLAYSGDTGPSERLVKIASNADVLLAEASFQHGEDNPPDLHLTGREAGEHAARAAVGRLLLTHIPPWGDPARAHAEAAEVFTGPIELAVSGVSHKI